MSRNSSDRSPRSANSLLGRQFGTRIGRVRWRRRRIARTGLAVHHPSTVAAGVLVVGLSVGSARMQPVDLVEDSVGTWNSGPFNNDTAADWCGDLDDANPGDRPTLIRAALARVADESDYLDSDFACEAIAAAAILAAQLPGGQPIDPVYAPAFLRDGGSLEVPEVLTALAVRAIDRIMAPRTPNGALSGRKQLAEIPMPPSTLSTTSEPSCPRCRRLHDAPGEQATDTGVPLRQAEEHSVTATTIPWRQRGTSQRNWPATPASTSCPSPAPGPGPRRSSSAGNASA